MGQRMEARDSKYPSLNRTLTRLAVKAVPLWDFKPAGIDYIPTSFIAATGFFPEYLSDQRDADPSHEDVAYVLRPENAFFEPHGSRCRTSSIMFCAHSEHRKPG